ncbi:MAG TPA: hypothetical protein VFN64_03945 [Burkholderiaceae bacterium]|nr:hypothetical protein [Burkholderiaceae bacterium]
MPIRGDRLRWPPRPGKRSNVARSGSESRGSGTRQTLSTDEQKPAPRQPNERDASADSQTSPPRDVIKRAHDDVTEGQVDTDCRNSAAEIVERNDTKRRRTP